MEGRLHHPAPQAKKIIQKFQKLWSDCSLSPVAKLVERLLLPEVQEHLPLADHQHGFRQGHSTTTTLDVIVQKISTGGHGPDRRLRHRQHLGARGGHPSLQHHKLHQKMAVLLPQGAQHLRGVQRQAVHHEEGLTGGAPRRSVVASALQHLRELHAHPTSKHQDGELCQ